MKILVAFLQFFFEFFFEIFFWEFFFGNFFCRIPQGSFFHKVLFVVVGIFEIVHFFELSILMEEYSFFARVVFSEIVQF